MFNIGDRVILKKAHDGIPRGEEGKVFRVVSSGMHKSNIQSTTSTWIVYNKYIEHTDRRPWRFEPGTKVVLLDSRRGVSPTYVNRKAVVVDVNEAEDKIYIQSPGENRYWCVYPDQLRRAANIRGARKRRQDR